MNPTALLARPPEQLTSEEIRRLGQVLGGLASWWLRSEILERFEQERGWPVPRKPPLPSTHGSCWILLAQRDPQPCPPLRDAFFLPLHWQKGKDWDSRLPDSLLALGKEMAVEMDLTDYALRLHPVIQPAPSALPSPPSGFAFESAAISLAGGLYVAARDGEPDPTVSASACWKKAEGVLGVDEAGLRKKLTIAVEWGMRTFFVAREQSVAVPAGAAGLEIRELPQGRSRLEMAIQEFVVRQKAEPAPSTGLSDESTLRRNVEHWAFLPAEHKGAFYLRRLFPWVLSRFADLILQEPDVAQARPLQALVTIVTGQTDTTILAARALTRLGVRHCLLLYTKDERKEQQKKAAAIRQQLLQGLESAGEQWPTVTCEPHAFDPKERGLEQLVDGIRTFSRRFPSEQLILDITGGKSLMKWVAERSAGSRVERPSPQAGVATDLRCCTRRRGWSR